MRWLRRAPQPGGEQREAGQLRRTVELGGVAALMSLGFTVGRPGRGRDFVRLHPAEAQNHWILRYRVQRHAGKWQLTGETWLGHAERDGFLVSSLFGAVRPLTRHVALSGAMQWNTDSFSVVRLGANLRPVPHVEVSVVGGLPVFGFLDRHPLHVGAQLKVWGGPPAPLGDDGI